MEKLCIKGLEMGYNNDIIIDSLSLEINCEDITVILGPSGSGKSTLLKGIAGLEEPKTGYISLSDLTYFDSKESINIPMGKRKIGFVFQKYSLWPHMTVEENVLFALKENKSYCKNFLKEKGDFLLNEADILDKKFKYPHELSGGEQQRVALVRALAIEPNLLLLDEPLANIDPLIKNKLINLIKKIKLDFGVPMIYVTHDQKEAFDIADKILIMNEGEVLQYATPKEVYKFPSNEFVAKFIGNNNIVSDYIFDEKISKKNCLKLQIRPEDIEITLKGNYEGRIQKIIYKGGYNEIYIRFNNICLKTITIKDSYKKGEIIRFNILDKHYIKTRNVKKNIYSY